MLPNKNSSFLERILGRKKPAGKIHLSWVSNPACQERLQIEFNTKIGHTGFLIEEVIFDKTHKNK